MRQFIRNIETTELDGGCLCLNFTNTIQNRFEQPVHDYLTDINEWIKWVKRLELLSVIELDHAISFVQKNPEQASICYQNIIEVREIIYQIFRSITKDLSPPKSVEKLFNNLLTQSLTQVKIQISKNRIVSEVWGNEQIILLKPLNLIVKSAYELLKSDTLHRVKECNCSWLFLDKSKNNSRRWCSMQTCGSSTKSKRYYNKKKNTST